MPPKINPDYAYFDLRMIRSKIHGRGVRANERIPANRYVIEYTGRLLSRRRQLEDNKARQDAGLAASPFVWEINGYWNIDGEEGGSGAEFVNHSCDPNLRVAFRGMLRVFYISRRGIKKGEELTIDYGFEPDPNPVPCLCGSKKCRGTINRL